MHRKIPSHRPGRLSSSTAALSLAGSALLLATGCGDDSTIWEPRGSSQVALAFQNLPPLQGGLNYQAWAVEYRNAAYWGSPMGIFNFDQDGLMVDPTTDAPLSGTFEAMADAEDLHGVQVTIEMSEVVVSQPSGIYILGGTIVDGIANLGQESWLSIGEDFSQIQGRYFLATPSDAVEDNEKSGVWFADWSGGTPTRGLDIPEAPQGWDYESWVVLGDDTLTGGKFYSTIIADTTNLYGGITGDYTFPGQDFIQNPPEGLTFPTDLSGAYTFITMEPEGEYDLEMLAPFPIKILEATIPLDAEPHTTYQMTPLQADMPRGTATVLPG